MWLWENPFISQCLRFLTCTMKEMEEHVSKVSWFPDITVSDSCMLFGSHRDEQSSAEDEYQSTSEAIPVSSCTVLPCWLFLKLLASASGLLEICFESIPWQDATCQKVPSKVLRGLFLAWVQSLFVLEMISSRDSPWFSAPDLGPKECSPPKYSKFQN